jgi:hypothetical protein
VSHAGPGAMGKHVTRTRLRRLYQQRGHRVRDSNFDFERLRGDRFQISDPRVSCRLILHSGAARANVFGEPTLRIPNGTFPPQQAAR